MHRAPFVLSGTALGLAGVLSLQSASPGTSHPLFTSPARTTATTTPSTTTTSASRTTSASAARTATGTDVQYQYGDLELKVTTRGGRIADISVVQLNVTDPHSQEIDQQAIPALRAEALSAQSAKIDVVSGASYTSQAYAQSLQAALDKLKA